MFQYLFLFISKFLCSERHYYISLLIIIASTIANIYIPPSVTQFLSWWLIYNVNNNKNRIHYFSKTSNENILYLSVLGVEDILVKYKADQKRCNIIEESTNCGIKVSSCFGLWWVSDLSSSRKPCYVL